jgi:hypothetical protein
LRGVRDVGAMWSVTFDEIVAVMKPSFVSTILTAFLDGLVNAKRL